MEIKGPKVVDYNDNYAEVWTNEDTSLCFEISQDQTRVMCVSRSKWVQRDKFDKARSLAVRAMLHHRGLDITEIAEDVLARISKNKNWGLDVAVEQTLKQRPRPLPIAFTFIIMSEVGRISGVKSKRKKEKKSHSQSRMWQQLDFLEDL